MTSRQTHPYGNRAHHTGQGVPLGAPGTTGAVETHDPLGAPGSTGASPTTGYGAGAGCQEQLHRPVGQTTDQGYAYGTAASMGHAGHARVAVPHTTAATGGYETGAHGTGEGHVPHTTRATAGYDTRAYGTGGGHVGGYDTGGFVSSTDVGHTTGIGQQRGHEGRHGGGYDTGGDKSRGHDTGGGQTYGQGLGGGHVGGYDIGGGQTQTQGLGSGRSGGYDTGGGQAHDTGRSKSHGQEVKGRGSGYDTGGVKGRADTYDTGDQTVEVSATRVEVVTEEPIEEEESKGIMDKIMEHLPGTGGGTTK
ncbi:hypothetical protein RND81_13G182900 [Saponaria officinalis]|uniref:Uncharacterized protein n=1 Tax=Saponaria officinalis TaxID=3572 RepID=A0AAW1GZA5_SAPOF